MSTVVPYLVVLASAVLAVLLVQTGTDRLVRWLGRDKFLSPEAVNGCNWWPVSAMISIAASGFGNGLWGWPGLGLILAGPAFCIITASVWLRFGERQARRREFEIRNGRVIEISTEEQVVPSFVESTANYYCNGPATGYTLGTLTLHTADARTFTNGYVYDGEQDADFLALTRDCGCLGLTLVVESWDDETLVRHIAFGNEWTALLCGDLRLDEHARQWWRQWLQPAFGDMGRKEVTPEELIVALDALQNGLGERIAQTSRIGSDIAGIENLLDSAVGPIQMVTQKAHISLVEERVRRGWVQCHIEDGVWIDRLEPK